MPMTTTLETLPNLLDAPKRPWQELLETEVLPRVEKPARYTGGEWNIVTKPWEATPFRFVVLYPDTYELGMFNLAIQIIYDMGNRWRSGA
jgi:hypothetical protein